MSSTSGMAGNHGGVAFRELELVGGKRRGFVREARWGRGKENEAREQHDGELRWKVAMKNGEGRGLQAMGGRGRELPLSSLDWVPLAQSFHFFKYFFLTGVVNSPIRPSLNGVKSLNCPLF